MWSAGWYSALSESLTGWGLCVYTDKKAFMCHSVKTGWPCWPSKKSRAQVPFGLGSHYHRDAGSGLERWPEGLCEGEHSSAKSASACRTHLVQGTINRKHLVPC